MRRLHSALFVMLAGGGLVLSVPVRSVAVPRQAAASTARASETALDRYVAAPDPSFAWTVSKTLPAEGATATLIDLTSQRWLTEADVEQPVWKHWLVVVTPEKVTSDIGLLFISGGRNDRNPPGDPVEMARRRRARHRHGGGGAADGAEPARGLQGRSRAQAADRGRLHRLHLEAFPAHRRRPLAGAPADDEERRARDGCRHRVRVVGAGGSHTVGRFVVSGASKRGWTTWTTAAVDTRVIAIAPAVIDLLNVEPSFIHHFRAYGAYSDAVKDYVEQGVMDWIGTPQFRALMKIEEPYEYRERLTMPKLLVNASGDQFFLPDSSQFYFDKLRGENHLRYVPNTSHALDKSDALESLHAFYASVVKGTPRPEFSWTFEKDGAIKVVSKERPEAVTLWQATNPDARNFRLDAIGPAYQSTVLTPSGPNTWVARVPAPAKGGRRSSSS